MKIILEGPDGAGKSTLAKKLAVKYNLDTGHMTRLDPMDYMFLSQTLRKENMVWDRHFISEIVYSITYNRECSLSKKQIDDLFGQCNEEGIKLLICLPEIYHIQDNEPDFIKNKHTDLIKWYSYLANKYNLITIDPKKMDIDDIYKEIGGDVYAKL